MIKPRNKKRGKYKADRQRYGLVYKWIWTTSSHWSHNDIVLERSGKNIVLEMDRMLWSCKLQNIIKLQATISAVRYHCEALIHWIQINSFSIGAAQSFEISRAVPLLQTCPKNCGPILSVLLRWLFIYYYLLPPVRFTWHFGQPNCAVQLVLSYCLKRQALLTRGRTNLRCSEQNRA